MKIENNIGLNLSELNNVLDLKQVQNQNITNTKARTELGAEFKEILSHLENKFELEGKMDTKFTAQLENAPKNLRSVFELQRAAYKLNSSTELLSRTAESLSSSLKRLQQMGSS